MLSYGIDAETDRSTENSLTHIFLHAVWLNNPIYCLQLGGINAFTANIYANSIHSVQYRMIRIDIVSSPF